MTTRRRRRPKPDAAAVAASRAIGEEVVRLDRLAAEAQQVREVEEAFTRQQTLSELLLLKTRRDLMHTQLGAAVLFADDGARRALLSEWRELLSECDYWLRRYEEAVREKRISR